MIYFVKALIDLDCHWEGLPPVYRIFVGDELFVEREWVWTNHYLEEMLQIQAEAGIYEIKIDVVGPSLSKFSVTNPRIVSGPARWLDLSTLEVIDPRSMTKAARQKLNTV